MIDNQPLTITLGGQTVPLGLDSSEPLVRAVIISLFTWRRANPDDDLPGAERMGWWGDSFPVVPNDRIGSRLWLLLRAKLTDETVQRAREYAEEALQWLVDDGIADRIEVVSSRIGIFGLALGCTVFRPSGSQYSDLWVSLQRSSDSPIPARLDIDFTLDQSALS